MNGKVFLVGAGPGDPELLTLRALSILQTVDVVLHDDLVTPEILSLIRTVRVTSVGKRCGVKRIAQETINARMIECARSGFNVARLKGGDPLIFGRSGEEMEALHAAGIEFEVVPGVMAAAGAAASARVPLTDRRLSSQVTLLSGHHSPIHARREDFASASDSTLVVHMPDDYASLAADLRAAGVRAETPCLLVSNATRDEQQIYRTTLEDLPRVPRFPSPAILIVGKVAGTHAPLAETSPEYVSCAYSPLK